MKQRKGWEWKWDVLPLGGDRAVARAVASPMQ